MEGFAAYPSAPNTIGHSIETAEHLLSKRQRKNSFKTWRTTSIPGEFLFSPIRKSIEECDFLLFDISYPNFNVIYEVGYAIGKRKPILPVINRTLEDAGKYLRYLGIFDTITFEEIENGDDIYNIVNSFSDNSKPISIDNEINQLQPVYILDTLRRGEVISRIFSSVKSARIGFRSFDPKEQPRLSAMEAIKEVSASSGVIIPLLGIGAEDHEMHNLRAAFLIGLAHGMEKEALIIQQGEDPVPLDYREFVSPINHPSDVANLIGDFALRAFAALQKSGDTSIGEPRSFLESLTLGSSAAENEYKSLHRYFVETHEYQRALRGEGRIVVGRKGSGKTAIFWRVRDRKRDDPNLIVLDLKPDGYQLRKFKEQVLKMMQEGTKEHTITAFWEYLLLLEICHKILEADRKKYLRDPELYERYMEISAQYRTDDYIQTGDFSERMSKLLSNIDQNFKSEFGNDDDIKLDQEKLTNLLHLHDVKSLKVAISNYMRSKDGIWILIDNVDKGWPPTGLQPDDILMVRTLVESTRKIEREFNREGFDCNSLIFIRNDVYELLVDNTADRGKEGLIEIDWTDREWLREVLRRRLVYSGADEKLRFDSIWRQICNPIIDAKDSSDYLIDMCLMRPRFLIQILEYCVSSAVNLKHEKIEVEDIKKGSYSFSLGLIDNFGYELRDVYSDAEDIIYAFIECDYILSYQEVRQRVIESGFREEQADNLISLLIWFSFFGVERGLNDVRYIYDTHYKMPLLVGGVEQDQLSKVTYIINPAFWPSLQIITE